MLLLEVGGSCEKFEYRIGTTARFRPKGLHGAKEGPGLFSSHGMNPKIRFVTFEHDDKETRMNDAVKGRPYQESRIEDEPILGPVLALPDGRFKRLTWLERVLVALGLTNAKLLEARHFKPARS